MANIIEELKSKFPDIAFEQDAAGAIVVPSEKIVEVCAFLRNAKPSFDYLSSITAVDIPPDKIELVYHLFSLSDNKACVLKAKLSREAPLVDSLADLYHAADWHERETYDLFGVVFNGHPNLLRILTPEGCKGYPLRKDYTDARIIVKPKQEVKNI